MKIENRCLEELLRQGFLPMGQSDIFLHQAKFGVEREILVGDRDRYALPNTDIRVTNSEATTALYRVVNCRAVDLLSFPSDDLITFRRVLEQLKEQEQPSRSYMSRPAPLVLRRR